MANYADFYKSMAQARKAQRDKLEVDSEKIWGVALRLVHAIAESPHDGSGIGDLMELGKECQAEMKALLEQ